MPRRAAGAGTELPLDGLAAPDRLGSGRPRTVQVEGDGLLVGGPEENVEARILRWLKRHAADARNRETQEFAAKAGVSVSRVGVGDPLSRWGSCSSSGAIRYSWRLILAPDWVRRATVAHEVGTWPT